MMLLHDTVTTAQGMKYRRHGTHIEKAYHTADAPDVEKWGWEREENIPINVARFLLTDFTISQDCPLITANDFGVYDMALGAVRCLLWLESDNPDERDDYSLEDNGCTIQTLDKEDWHKLYAECATFLQTCQDYGVGALEADRGQIGHDFILTRNGHGTGFWDREELYGRDYLFLSFLASRYPEVSGQREGSQWSIFGLTET